MRLLLAWMVLLGACGSSGHAGPPGGGAGGGPARGAGVSLDTFDALVIDAGDTAGGADTGSMIDAEPTFSCQVATDAGGQAACIDLDPGYLAPDAGCPAGDAEPVMAGYTVWWYAPLGAGAVLSRCEQMGDSYVSP